MSTDQIQSKLYERSDRETEKRVKAAVQPLSAFVGNNMAQSHQVSLKFGLFTVWTVGGEKLTQQDDANRIRDAFVAGNLVHKMPVSELLAAIEKTLKESLKSADRKQYVEQFIADVENLKAQGEELAARLDDVERG